VRVVVDTNVLVSGLISSRGAPARIVEAILDQRIVPVFSKETFSELRAVLQRPKFKHYFNKSGLAVGTVLANLTAIGEFVEPRPAPARIRDPKDRPFLEVAAASPPPEFIVTGDRDFQDGVYGGVPVLSPAAFLLVVLAEKKA
jgi:putative PIN family toxin of toxin-antitoxin system